MESRLILLTGTGTGVGKTWVARGLARALAASGRRVLALKPIETGCDPDPADAIALARACGRPELANADGLYRARPALSPWAATLEGAPPLELDALLARVRELAHDALTLIEGAGGLWVPLDAQHLVIDLAAALQARLVLVARDELGVLSHVIGASEAIAARGLDLAACVLSVHDENEPSRRTNRTILAERLECPVLTFEHTRDDDDALAAAAQPLLAALAV